MNAALSRFISHLREKVPPLYKELKKTKKFQWTNEATVALEEIKTLLAGNPILTDVGVKTGGSRVGDLELCV